MTGRWVALSLGLAGCAAPTAGDHHGEPVGTVRQGAGSVADALGAGCSTTSVWGLSEQVVAELNCLVPGSLVELPVHPQLSLGAAVFPFLEPPAADALLRALARDPTRTLPITSMLRTVAQQYLLYAWSQAGACGISLAATPGRSNHESGLAFDTSAASAWRPALEAEGFAWLGSADPVHFDYEGPGAVDLRGQDVLAFQRLWNVNHPEDRIDEDGLYGDETEARLLLAPADGFPLGSSCTAGAGGAGGTGAAGSAGLGGGAGAGGVGGAGMGGGAGTTTSGGGGGTDQGGASGVAGQAGAGGSGAEPGRGGAAGAVGEGGAAASGSRSPAADAAGCTCQSGRRPALGGGLALGGAALALAGARRRRRSPRPR